MIPFYLRKKIRELDAEERVGAMKMYIEFWRNWAENQLKQMRRPLIFNAFIKEIR